MAGEIIRGVIAFTILIIWTITPVILAFKDLDKKK